MQRFIGLALFGNRPDSGKGSPRTRALVLTSPPPKGTAMNGTAVYGEPVVIVEVDHGDVRLKTGHIVSNGSSHLLADNCQRTVVGGDRDLPALNRFSDTHAKEFQVDDIHLLKSEEARALRDPANAHEWFGSIYQDSVVSEIQRALKRLKL